MCIAKEPRNMPQERSSGASPGRDGGSARNPGAGLAAMVRAHRRLAGLTQRQLAALAGISVAALRDLEQGRIRQPRAESVARLARVLGLDPGPARQLGWAVQDAGAIPVGCRSFAGTGVSCGVGSLRVVGEDPSPGVRV
jgi:hypothetical protein